MEQIATAVLWIEQLPTAWKLLVALIALMSIDIATGVLAAGHQWRLSSKVGMRGVTKKALTLLGVATGGVVQLVLDHLPVTAEFPSAMILSAVVGWYIVVELLSIVENFARAGVNIPIISTLAVRFAEAAKQSGVITGTTPVASSKTVFRPLDPTPDDGDG